MPDCPYATERAELPCATSAAGLSVRGADRLLVRWSLIGAAALWLALAGPFFAGRVYVADDLAEFHLPLRQFYSQQLVRGEPFDWMPSLYCGYYQTGEGQLGGYHPLHLALYRWLPLVAAYDLELLLSYPAIFAGTYLLLRRIVRRAGAALFGALVFAFGSFNLLHFAHPNGIAVAAHIPWLVWLEAIRWTTRDRRVAAAAWFGIGLLTASQILLGYPQYVWFSLLAETAAAAWILVAASRSRGHGWGTIARIVDTLAAKAIGLVAGGIQLAPTLDFLAESTRQTADAAFASTGSLHPLNLVQCVGPYLFATRVVGQNTHELGLYLGAVPLVACLWLLMRCESWGRRRPAVIALMIAAAAALLLAAGEHGGLHLLTAWLPGINRFRFSCRAIVLVQLATAGLAAIAVVQMAKAAQAAGTPPDKTACASRGGGLFQIGRAGGVAFALSLAVLLAGLCLWPEYLASWWLMAIGPVAIALAGMLVHHAACGARWAWIGLVAFTAFDLGAYGLSCHILPSTAVLDNFAAQTGAPPDIAAGMPRVAASIAIPDQPQLRTGNRLLLAGWSRIDGYTGLEPARRLDYRDPNVQRLAGARWSHFRTPAGPAWNPLPNPLPRARFVERTIADENLSPLPGALLGPVAAIDQRDAEPTASAAAAPPGQATITLDRPGRIELNVATPARALLVLAESFHRGWQAAVDGTPAPVVRVNGDFMGVWVAAGSNRVEWVFRPASLWWGRLASECGLGLLMVGLMVRLARSAGAPRAAPVAAESVHASTSRP